jgi:hypothetical protein
MTTTLLELWLLRLVGELRRSEGEALKREGMAEVEAGANPEWIAAAEACVRMIVHTGVDFTSDDVRALMHVHFPGVWTRDERVMGPVIGGFARAGVIEKAPRLPANSTRKQTHGSLCTYWRPTRGGTDGESSDHVHPPVL